MDAQSDLLPERSVARRVDRELFVLLGGTAALLMQVSHPLVAAGVEQHSDFVRDPIGPVVTTEVNYSFHDTYSQFYLLGSNGPRR